MRLRDILLFNQAMLAKLSWRIIKDPSNLLARKLKGRYFKDKPFVEVSLRNNPSLTWRSIMWGDIFFLRVITGELGMRGTLISLVISLD